MLDTKRTACLTLILQGGTFDSSKSSTTYTSEGLYNINMTVGDYGTF